MKAPKTSKCALCNLRPYPESPGRCEAYMDHRGLDIVRVESRILALALMNKMLFMCAHSSFSMFNFF